MFCLIVIYLPKTIKMKLAPACTISPNFNVLLVWKSDMLAKLTMCEWASSASAVCAVCFISIIVGLSCFLFTTNRWHKADTCLHDLAKFEFWTCWKSDILTASKVFEAALSASSVSCIFHIYYFVSTLFLFSKQYWNKADTCQHDLAKFQFLSCLKKLYSGRLKIFETSKKFELSSLDLIR